MGAGSVELGRVARTLAGYPHHTTMGEKALVGGDLETGQPQEQKALDVPTRNLSREII